MSFPLQISETMGAQNERHLQVSMFVDFVNRHQVGSFLYFLFTPKCTLFLSPSLPPCVTQDIKRIVCVQSVRSRWIFVAGISTLQLRLVL